MFNLQDPIIVKDLAIQIIKGLISPLPFGSILNEYINHKERVEQSRLNKFVESLYISLTEKKISSGIEVNPVDFGYLLEAVMRRVAVTKSEKKHAHFKNILLNYLSNPVLEVDESGLYLDLISDLNEIAIIILKGHRVFNRDYYDKQIQMSNADQLINNLNERIPAEVKSQQKGYANNAENLKWSATN